MSNLPDQICPAGERQASTSAARLWAAAKALFQRRRKRRRPIDLAQSAFQRSNYLRSDIGLPPLDSGERPL
jgi:hypothetical protein